MTTQVLRVIVVIIAALTLVALAGWVFGLPYLAPSMDQVYDYFYDSWGKNGVYAMILLFTFVVVCGCFAMDYHRLTEGGLL
ncbi:hypothetical protein HQ544_01375 [Candidatus Falkowbacteria bacterium]|nr:hypothetical protein [Candidatus Falkowbacteria bacterium]